jgi:hypothetical protein
MEGYEEIMIVSKSSEFLVSSLSSEEDSSSDDELDENNNKKASSMQTLILDFKLTLENYANKDVLLHDFFVLYEAKFNRTFNCLDYGQRSIEMLLSKLARAGVITHSANASFNHVVRLLSPLSSRKISADYDEGYNENGSNKSSEKFVKRSNHGDNINAQIEETELTLEEFIESECANSESLNPMTIWKKFFNKKTIDVIVSSVEDPTNFTIQLAENKNNLDILMRDMEAVYCGFNTTIYDIPDYCVTQSRIVAGLYSVDKNWHRCRILDVQPKKRLAKVNYVDYGGSGWLSFDDIKLLDKKFTKLPIQTIDVKLYGVKIPSTNSWPKNIQSYFLNLVGKDKVHKAKIIGINNRNARFSLELIMITRQSNNEKVCPSGTSISLNKRVVTDGMGQFYDELKEDMSFFENIETICQRLNIRRQLEDEPLTHDDKYDKDTSSIFRKPFTAQTRTKAFSDIFSEKKTIKTFFKINNVIYMLWQDVADILKFDPSCILEDLFNLKQEFVKTLKYTSQQQELFAQVNEMMSENEKFIFFIDYKTINKIVDAIYKEPLASFIKEKVFKD